MRVAGLARDPERAGDAAGGPAHENVDGQLPAPVHRRQPAVRAQDVQVRGHVAPGHLALEIG